MRDPYLYKDVDVLKNKLNIKNQEELDKYEQDITIANLASIDNVTGNFDYEHYKRVHKAIFGDIYEWAGEERDIEMVKGEEVLGFWTVNYTYPAEITKTAKTCFKNLNSRNWQTMSLDEKAEQFAIDIAAIWKTHPFREGNTRTTITFACMYADAHGFPMDRQIFAEYSKYTRKALVMASIQPYEETQHLTKIFKDSMESGMEKQNAKENKQTSAPDCYNTSRYNNVLVNSTPVNGEPNKSDEYET